MLKGGKTYISPQKRRKLILSFGNDTFINIHSEAKQNKCIVIQKKIKACKIYNM